MTTIWSKVRSFSKYCFAERDRKKSFFKPAQAFYPYTVFALKAAGDPKKGSKEKESRKHFQLSGSEKNLQISKLKFKIQQEEIWLNLNKSLYELCLVSLSSSERCLNYMWDPCYP